MKSKTPRLIQSSMYIFNLIFLNKRKYTVYREHIVCRCTQAYLSQIESFSTSYIQTSQLTRYETGQSQTSADLRTRCPSEHIALCIYIYITVERRALAAAATVVSFVIYIYSIRRQIYGVFVPETL